jgi:hypothetical protein
VRSPRHGAIWASRCGLAIYCVAPKNRAWKREISKNRYGCCRTRCMRGTGSTERTGLTRSGHSPPAAEGRKSPNGKNQRIQPAFFLDRNILNMMSAASAKSTVARIIAIFGCRHRGMGENREYLPSHSMNAISAELNIQSTQYKPATVDTAATVNETSCPVRGDIGSRLPDARWEIACLTPPNSDLRNPTFVSGK